MRKIVLLIVFVSLIFFNFSRPVYAGGCVEGSDGVTYDCQCLNYDKETETCLYMDCHVGGCCESDNTCPAPSSFLPGTLVNILSGERKIEDIRVGDEVLSFKDEKIAYSKVIRIFKYSKPYYYILEAGEYMVKVTYNHPFYIGSNQFKIVEELKVGDTVYVLENNQLIAKEITQKTRVEEESYVYNMTVDNTNTYFAGGFAVHNKGGSGDTMTGGSCSSGYRADYSQVTRTFCTADFKDLEIQAGDARQITGCFLFLQFLSTI